MVQLTDFIDYSRL